jgi:hypothetical protein
MKIVLALSGFDGIIGFFSTMKKMQDVKWADFCDISQVPGSGGSASHSVFGQVFVHPRYENGKSTLTKDREASVNILDSLRGFLELEDKDFDKLQGDYRILSREDSRRLMYYSLPALFSAMSQALINATTQRLISESARPRVRKIFTTMKFGDQYKKPMCALSDFVCRATICLAVNRKGIEKLNPIFKNNFDERDLFMLQLQIRLVFCAAMYPKSWLCSLLFQPGKWVNKFLPGAITAVSMVERVKWYTCPNGHPFSIGECGKPMVKAVCFCGAEIGGESHRAVAGTREMGDMPHDAEMFFVKGYTYSAVDVIPNFPAEVIDLLRFLTNLTLYC